MSDNKANLNLLDNRLKEAIQTLFYIQSGVHNYRAETTAHLVEQIQRLQPQLAALGAANLPSLPQVTPEIVDYVDNGRNPDIYIREFVELVQKSNAYLKGKVEAFTEFRDVLGEEIVVGLGPELEPLVLKATGRGDAGQGQGSGIVNGV